MCFPSDKIAFIENTDADTMQIHFHPGTDNTAGSVIFEITSGYGKAFCRILFDAINTGHDPMIVVADDIRSEYLTGTTGAADGASAGTTVAATACTTIALL
tara:strand:+ start:3908 stop:4210 length:303 start_codon:yes stop_codon:yes gene_type:complete